MARRLVQLEDGRRARSWRLDAPELVIGRDEDADILVEHLRASRRHALIELDEGTHLLSDLESANGTLLNGEPVEPRTPLEPGDEIRIADEVVFLYAPRGRLLPVIVVGVLMGVALGALLAWQLRTHYWYWAPLWDATMREARDTAADAVSAWESGNAPRAKRGIQAAYWLLYGSDRLRDVPREQVWNEGLARLEEALGGEVDLDGIFQQASAAEAPPAPVATAAREVKEDPRPACRLDQSAPSEIRPCLEAYVDYVCAELRQDPKAIPAWFYDAVGNSLVAEAGRIPRALERGERYVPMMTRVLEEARMPPMLHYLAMAESGYLPDALSPVGALGQWQFMARTARRYGLRVGGDKDERRDPERSTRAAAEYLRDLTLEFGGDSLLLALAGYNRGEDGVRQSLRQLDDPFSDRSYWTLVERHLLPEETRYYVARIFAQAVAGEGGVPSPTTLRRAGFRAADGTSQSVGIR